MADRPAASPRARGAAALLPFVGLFLLMPPVIRLFALERDIGGVPLIVIYLFGIWLGLIICAAWLSRRFARRRPPDASRASASSAQQPVDPPPE